MGRLRGASAAKRGRLRRPLLVFAVLLLGPAVGFCLLGWDSLKGEHEFRLRDMHRAARDALVLRMNDAVGALERVRKTEAGRAYFEYQTRYVPHGQVVGDLAFQRSALDREPADARILGWFQWELFHGTAYGVPEVLPRSNRSLRGTLPKTYGAALRERLQRAPRDADLRDGRVAVYPLRVVAANEERGQLEEEIEVRQRSRDGRIGPYEAGFNERTRDERPIRVRYSPFRYLARPRAVPGPTLIAWRLVWIPAEQIQWRETKGDRWIIQGYVLDPSSLFPAEWTSIGATQIRRGDGLDAEAGPGVVTDSLALALDADIAGVSALPGGLPSVYAPSLVLAARADMRAAEELWRDARNRFLLLVSGLIVVVAVGFFVLVRSVRREVSLVQRKEDFMAAITHELKTPLTGIRMYAEMLREGWVASPEAADKYAGRILEETDRLGHLVSQVLDLAALERGVAALSAQPGDLGEAARSAVALLESKAEQAGVDLAVEVEEGLPIFSFDPQLVRPLVLNLVDNAIKYSARAEEKFVRVRVYREGERVVLSVVDKGAGIGARARKRIFDPFQRGGNELTREAPGVGIGLALVKRYADAHRARVQILSEVGQGTTVSVRFPTS